MKFSELLLEGFRICVRRKPPAEWLTVYYLRDGRLTIADSTSILVSCGMEKGFDANLQTEFEESINEALRSGNHVTIYTATGDDAFDGVKMIPIRENHNDGFPTF